MSLATMPTSPTSDLVQLTGAGRTSDEGSQLNVTFVR